MMPLEGNNMSLYIDNVLKSTNNYARTINDLSTNLLAYLGKSFYNSDPYFKGYFDNFKVYNRVLTESEILTGVEKILSGYIDFYPVPFRNSLTISTGEYKDPTSILIFDANGRIMDSTNFINGELTLNTDNYAPGIYLLKILQGNRSVTKVISKK